jgi:DNA-binding beta-propeller fold protein YncE
MTTHADSAVSSAFFKVCRPLAAVLAASLLLTAAACGPEKRPPEPEDLFWPLPPDQPRIKYLQSIYSEDDIGREYTFWEKIFGKDYFDRLIRPYGISVRNNAIVVSDIGLRKVFVFDRTAKKLRVLKDRGALLHPSASASDAAGRVYVADGQGAKIVVFDPSGAYKTAFVMKDARPVGLALNERAGRLYVADAAGHRIVVFGLDGKQLFAFGGQGRDRGKFNLPLDVAVDLEGAVYVLDARNFRVQIFDADGRFLRTFGSVGDGPGFFANPKGIDVDSEGHIYVTDAAFNNFQIFDSAGNTLLFIGNLGPRPGQLHLPAGIAVDDQDRIYVADQLNGRIQVFQYLKEKAVPAGPARPAPVFP